MRTIPLTTIRRGLLVSAIAVGIIVDRSAILKYQNDLDETKQTKAAQAEATRLEEQNLEQLQSDSEKALSRAQSGCVQIVYTENNKPVRFHNQIRVFDPNTFPKNPKIPRFDKKGNPINGVQFMPPGIIVCNPYGDTAITRDRGFITKIYRVEPNRLAEFKSYLQP